MSKKSRHSYLPALIAALAIGGIIAILNFTNAKDYILAATFSPSESVEALAEQLELTDQASLIFKASHTELHDSDFNQYCEAESPDRSVLGCYDHYQIHIFNIEAPELAGIVESTAAHELLHAIWERLSGREKDQLLPVLNQVYLENYDDLKIVKDYPEASQASELYARVGTEIQSLNEDLEAHFARFFQNRDKIWHFYDSYSKPFSELSSALSLFRTEMDQLLPQIESEKSDYETRSTAFSKKVDEFNACAKKSGCFTSNSAFYAKRTELLAEQKNLNHLYDQLSSKINRYNELVESYNNNLLHEQELVKIINPNYEGGSIND